jgi:hypothetical protein
MWPRLRPQALLERLSAAGLIGILAVGLACVSVLIVFRRIPKPDDVALYSRYASEILKGRTPYRDFPAEYPPLAFVPIVLPGLSSPATTGGYLRWFLIENIVLSVMLAISLWRILRVELSPPIALRGLALFLVLAGSLSWVLLLRFDVFPALLAVLSIGALARGRPTLAGIWAALGMCAKLYPIFLIAVLAGYLLAERKFSSLGRLVAGCAIALLAVFLPFALITDGKVFMFLEYHQDRGLHVESVAGGFLLLAHHLHWAAVELQFKFNSFQLASPWADRIQNGMFLSTLALVGSAAVRSWFLMSKAHRQEGRVKLRSAAALAFFVILVSMISSKVLSPQYMIWLMPFAGFLRFRQAVLFLGICVMSTALYPFLYLRLLDMDLTTILLLNLRNGLMVGLAVWLACPRQKPRETSSWEFFEEDGLSGIPDRKAASVPALAGHSPERAS